jgi:hypothetical protein
VSIRIQEKRHFVQGEWVLDWSHFWKPIWQQGELYASFDKCGRKTNLEHQNLTFIDPRLVYQHFAVWVKFTVYLLHPTSITGKGTMHCHQHRGSLHQGPSSHHHKLLVTIYSNSEKTASPTAKTSSFPSSSQNSSSTPNPPKPQQILGSSNSSS